MRGSVSSRGSRSSSRIAVLIGRPAFWTIAATWNSSQPELSPRGAEIRRSARPLNSRPAATPRLAQQPLHAAVRRRLELPARARDRVEVGPVERRDEQLPRRRAVGRVALADGEVGAQRLAVVGQGDLELGRDRLLVGSGVALRREAPAEHATGELGEVGDDRFVVAVRRLADACAQQALSFGVAAIEDRAGAHERRG